MVVFCILLFFILHIIAYYEFLQISHFMFQSRVVVEETTQNELCGTYKAYNKSYLQYFTVMLDHFLNYIYPFIYPLPFFVNYVV